MAIPPPAEPGMALEEVDTPALLIELDPYERNLSRLAEEPKSAGMRLRPHAKMHKCAVIGRQQMALGAVGMCCQKVTEAEAMIHGGIGDVLVSNEVVGTPKIRRLMSLARLATVAVCADDADNVAQLSEAEEAFGVELSVLVELDVMHARCGVARGEPARNLARVIDGFPGLRFAGLHAYHGSAQHIRDYQEREAAIKQAAAACVETKALLEQDGLTCDVVTGAGTLYDWYVCVRDGQIESVWPIVARGAMR